jgi:hypothetical protein
MPRRTGATDKQEPLSQSLTAVGSFFPKPAGALDVGVRYG